MGNGPKESGKGKPGADDEVELDTDLHGDVETDSTGKNILIRDSDASLDTSELEILEYSSPNEDKPEKAEEPEGPDPYDPYNSGIFKVPDEDG